MKFVNRQPEAGKENRKLIRLCAGESAASGQFYADVFNADGAPDNANSALTAENLNQLTVNAANIEGTVPSDNLPFASRTKKGAVKMYVIDNTLYLENV